MTLNNIKLESPYLNLDTEFYELTEALALDEPYLISFNPLAGKLIGLDTLSANDPHLIEFLNGTFTPKDIKTFSMCYAGHQFGNYAPRLGDGRSLNLGKTQGWNLQLKGSGETFYSRGADGRTAMRSSIREYLMSEAMYHLGIPTTRALGIIGSKTKILRDKGMENAAMVMRMSTSWVRFGTFEYFSHMGKDDKLEALAEYVIVESYPHLIADEDRFFKMFCEVIERTATLISKWQGSGFCHGVINTDNMSIEGLTLDYGPFSMLDDFNYGHVCNLKDKVGRYSYGEQPNVTYWNLTMFAKALAPIISKERMEKKLDDFGDFIYSNKYRNLMQEKLGLQLKMDNDLELITKLLSSLQDAYVDYTLFFRTLSHYDGERMPLYEIAMNPVAIDNWLHLYDARLKEETQTQKEREKAMIQVNPKYILRNAMLQEAIRLAELGDFSMVETLLYISSHPYEELPEYNHLAEETQEEYKNIGLTCSS